jgi:hypothetical protein
VIQPQLTTVFMCCGVVQVPRLLQGCEVVTASVRWVAGQPCVDRVSYRPSIMLTGSMLTIPHTGVSGCSPHDLGLGLVQQLYR